MKQYRVNDHQLVKEYPFNEAISSVITTFDSKHAFAAKEDGFLHQISIDRKQVIKNYGEIHTDHINSMAGQETTTS